MQYDAKIVSVQEKGLWVVLDTGSGCGSSCLSKNTCGSWVLEGLLKKHEMLWVEKPVSGGYNFQEGQNVKLSIADGAHLLGSLIMFGVPLLGLLLGLLASLVLSRLFVPLLQDVTDFLAVIGIGSGMMLAYFLLRYFSSSYFLQKKLQLCL